MRRYTTLLLTAFLLLAIVIAGSAYLAGTGHIDHRTRAQEITVLTTLPAEEAEILSQAYEDSSGVHVTFVPLSSADVLERAKAQAGSPQKSGPAMVLADWQTLGQASRSGYLVPYLSERGDMVAAAFRQDDGYWMGVWYDPIIFCINRDYLISLHTDIPDTWQALADQDGRIGITDFMAADASSNLLYAMDAEFGDEKTLELLDKIHPRVVQYARYLSNPVRQAGMGEVDISIAVESETLRYIHDGYPLQIIYPADGTTAWITGTGILAGSGDRERGLAQNFADWLLSDEAQLALQSHNYFFVPTNPGTMAYQSFPGKNLTLFTQNPQFSAAEKHDLLDTWAREIRFK